MTEGGVIGPELLLSELQGGEISEDDYIGMSQQRLVELRALRNPSKSLIFRKPVFRSRFDYRRLVNVTYKDAIDIDEAYKLAESDTLTLEDGFVRCSDGSWYIACQTNLDEATGPMVDWWFCQCDNMERYKYWHPNDHISGQWDASYYSVQRHERKPGHYIGHVHMVRELIGGQAQDLRLEFLRPSKYFDITKLAEQHVTAVIIARIHVNDKSLGEISVGYFIHLVKQLEDGTNVLKSRFWLGKNVCKPPSVKALISTTLVNYIADTSLFKRLRISENTARNLYIHCKEEMSCLNRFLPSFYNKEMAAMKAQSKNENSNSKNNNNNNSSKSAASPNKFKK